MFVLSARLGPVAGVCVLQGSSSVCLLRVVEAAQVKEEPVDHNDDECPEDEHANEHERYGEYQPADEVEYTHACKVKAWGRPPPKK